MRRIELRVGRGYVNCVMKSMSVIVLLLSLSLTVDAQSNVDRYAPSFRYCPDRDFDIAWENDLVAFRVYGLIPGDVTGLSGVDCWHKRVSYPIVYKWYDEDKSGGSYHKDTGEGCDQYHVGKSRGCGGVGIWKDGEVLRSGLYESWEVTSQTHTSISFRLVYSWTIDGERIVETRDITLDNGSQLYSAVSHFTKNTFPIVGMDIAVGLSTQNSIAEVTLNSKEGWMSAWHELKDNQGMIGTGVIVDARNLVEMLEVKSDDADSSHALAIVKTDSNGAIEYQSGFAWEKAEIIKSRAEWNSYLEEKAK